jgi:hypothetical protein
MLLAALLAAVARPLPAVAGVQIAVLPAIKNVSPGAEFDMTLGVPLAGSGFNAFSATVTYDTTALTFMPAAPISAQQGCLMTGGCSAACGSTFHRFDALHDSLVISNSLLCNQISLTGPGTLYKLHFKARNVTQTTWIRFQSAAFLNAGLFVTPVTTADAQVGIGITLDAGSAPAPAAGLSVRAEPNPSRGQMAFTIQSDRDGTRSVEVFDLAGRLVRRLEDPRSTAGPSRLAWDGADESGARVRPGIYLVTVRAENRVARSRFAIVE